MTAEHDWWHIERVRKLALYINESEDLVDPFIVEIAALLHDTADSKICKGKFRTWIFDDLGFYGRDWNVRNQGSRF